MTITKDTPGIEIELIWEEETMSPDEQFEDEETLEWVREQIESGNEWAWFCAHVRVTYCAIVGDDYLGGCSYKSEDDFRSDGYFDSMVDDCIARINRELSRKPCPRCGQPAYPEQLGVDHG
jgi:hypothetical protein